MNDNNRQPIEDVLRRYAEQRRRALGGPLAMPAHVRARLHCEIERESAREAVGGRRGGIGRWRWLRRPWAWAGAVALVVVGSVVWQQFGPTRVKYAVAARAPAEPRVPDLSNPPPAIAPVNAAPALTRAADGLAEDRLTKVARRPTGDAELAPEAAIAGRVSEPDLAFKPVAANPSPTSRVSPPPAEAGVLATVAQAEQSATRYDLSVTTAPPTDATAFRYGAAASGVATVAPAPPAPEAPAKRGLAGAAPERRRVGTAFREVPSAPVLQQRFVQALATPATPVLNSFRIERAGQRIQLVDADGSVYAATLEETLAPKQQDALATTVPVTVPATVSNLAGGNAQAVAQPASQSAGVGNQNLQTLFLNASGTNIRLQQQVVFSGNLLVTNSAGNLAIANRQALMTNEAALQFLLSNSRLEGQVLIGGTNQFPVLAVPTQR